MKDDKPRKIRKDIDPVELAQMTEILGEMLSQPGTTIDSISETLLWERITEICHNTLNIWSSMYGFEVQPEYSKLERKEKDKVRDKVVLILRFPKAGPDILHDHWVREKIEEGYRYGKTMDEVARTHPCIVPFDDLPGFQQKRDKLFIAIVNALK